MVWVSGQMTRPSRYSSTPETLPSERLRPFRRATSVFSTHPAGASRIKELERNLPRVMPLYERTLARR